MNVENINTTCKWHQNEPCACVKFNPLYKQYCKCNNNPCHCIFTPITNFEKNIQEILVNNVKVAEINLKRNPKYKPKNIKQTQKPGVYSRVYTKTKKIRKNPGRPSYKTLRTKRALNTIINNAYDIIKQNIINYNKQIKIPKPLSKKRNKPRKKPAPRRIPTHLLTNKQKRRREYIERNKNKYQCLPCKYNTHDKSALRRHLKTATHKSIIANYKTFQI